MRNSNILLTWDVEAYKLVNGTVHTTLETNTLFRNDGGFGQSRLPRSGDFLLLTDNGRKISSEEFKQLKQRDYVELIFHLGYNSEWIQQIIAVGVVGSSHLAVVLSCCDDNQQYRIKEFLKRHCWKILIHTLLLLLGLISIKDVGMILLHILVCQVVNTISRLGNKGA
jgi:hypothetical protein